MNDLSRRQEYYNSGGGNQKTSIIESPLIKISHEKILNQEIG
jgi:hypothetical protein